MVSYGGCMVAVAFAGGGPNLHNQWPNCKPRPFDSNYAAQDLTIKKT